MATVTKADGTKAASGERSVVQSPYVSGGSSADFSDFAEEQGDGEYAFEVTAYDEAGSPLACGRSDPQKFYRVEMHVSVLDEVGEPLEGVQDGCSLMLTVDGSGSSSDYRPVQCRAGGAAELLARPANGYRFMGFSVDEGESITQNPYEFTLGAGFTVTATFQQDTTEIPATLHVGEGHEEYARQIADALNDAHGQGYAQVAEGGADVTYCTLKAQTLRSAASDLQSALWTLGQPSPGYLLGARESYTSFEEYSQEMVYGEDAAQLGERLDLYLVWNRVVPWVDVAVVAPVCGTQVTVDGSEWHPEQTPAPAVDVDGDDAACGGSWWSARGETVAFSGTIEGGATYTAHVSLSPAFGCVFDDTTAVRANGRAVEAELGFDGLAVEVPVVAEHDWAAGACAGCHAQQRTVAFDANGGSGTMESVSVADGQAYTLPACGFAAPAGKAFAGWLVGDATSASPVGAAVTVSGDVTLRASWAALPSKPEFRSCYLVLSGLIGVTFTVAVPQGFEAGDSRMDFEVRGEASSSVRMAGLEPDAYGRYHFTCYVNSVQMADSISATLRYGEGLSESVSASYSVQEYLRYFDGHTKDYDQATIDLVRAINDYGYYAQVYLSAENKWALDVGSGGKHVKMEKAYATSYDYSDVAGDVEKYAIYKDLGSSGVKASYRLHLDSSTGISVRVRPADEGVELRNVAGRFNGRVYRAEEQADGSWVVRVDGIPAHRLAESLDVSGYTEGGPFGVRVCALSYARTVFNGGGYGQAAKDAMAAFHRYYEAVEAYR